MMTVRRWALRALGAAAIAASCWLLFLALRSSWRDVVAMLSEESLVVPVVASSLLYGLGLGLLSCAWRNLVSTISGVRLSLRHGLCIYAIANVAKYLPGNVFHFAARQLLGRRAGQPHRAIAQATVLELALMVTCTVALVAIVGGGHLSAQLRMSALAPLSTPGQAWMALVAITVVGAGGALAILHKTGMLRRVLGIDVRDLAIPGLFVILFLAGQSTLAAYLGHPIGGARPPAPDSLIAAAYLLAWLAGLAVPGAPGGLGVREGVLVFLLGGVTGEAFALSLAVAMRFVTTAGEAVFAMVGYVLYYLTSCQLGSATGPRAPERRCAGGGRAREG